MASIDGMNSKITMYTLLWTCTVAYSLIVCLLVCFLCKIIHLQLTLYFFYLLLFFIVIFNFYFNYYYYYVSFYFFIIFIITIKFIEFHLLLNVLQTKSRRTSRVFN